MLLSGITKLPKIVCLFFFAGKNLLNMYSNSVATLVNMFVVFTFVVMVVVFVVVSTVVFLVLNRQMALLYLN